MIKISEIIKSAPLYEQLYRVLKTKILNGEIEAGTRVVDSKLAEEFGTSRSPIREAIRMLENEGLIINVKGTLFIYEPSLEDLIELYKVRAGLEYSAVYWGTSNITQEQLNKIEVLLNKTKNDIKENSYENIVEQNTEFHDEILFSSNNSRLIKMMEDIRSLIIYYRNILFLEFNNDYDFIDDHINVFKEIKEGNAKEAAQLMVEHINNDMKYFTKLFNDRG
ncbi:GntR family transcriptional regulator [Salinicoccus sp. Marseille-QA3877]